MDDDLEEVKRKERAILNLTNHGDDEEEPKKKLEVKAKEPSRSSIVLPKTSGETSATAATQSNDSPSGATMSKATRDSRSRSTSPTTSYEKERKAGLGNRTATARKRESAVPLRASTTTGKEHGNDLPSAGATMNKAVRDSRSRSTSPTTISTKDGKAGLGNRAAAARKRDSAVPLRASTTTGVEPAITKTRGLRKSNTKPGTEQVQQESEDADATSNAGRGLRKNNLKPPPAAAASQRTPAQLTQQQPKDKIDADQASKRKSRAAARKGKASGSTRRETPTTGDIDESQSTSNNRDSIITDVLAAGADPTIAKTRGLRKSQFMPQTQSSSPHPGLPSTAQFSQELNQDDDDDLTETSVLDADKETLTRAVARSTGTAQPTVRQQQEQQKNLGYDPEIPGAFALGGSSGLAADSTRMLDVSSGNNNNNQTDRQHFQTGMAVMDPFLSTGDSVPFTTTNTNTNTSGLVEAHEVSETHDLEMPQAKAQEFDPNEKQNRSRDYRKIAIGLTGVALLAIILGLYFGISSSGRKQQAPQLVPTMAPSFQPSGAPSSAPSFVLDDLLWDLPRYTLESLKTFDTPQSQAWAWLQTHQNVTNLPLWKKKQLFAMATFYYAMEGPSWPDYASSRWLDDTTSECLWFSSITGYVDGDGKWVEFQNADEHTDFHGSHQCNQQDGAIHTIFLSDLGLTANHTPFVPPEISFLTSLSYLGLSGNGIHAKLEDMIPSQMALLTDLEYLDYVYNEISGTIPSSIDESFQNANPLYLSLDLNAITGTIPKRIAQLTNLQMLHLSFNKLTGNIPTEIGTLKNVTYIKISYNQISGTMPSELGQLEKLEYLYMTDNEDLTGQIPSELGYNAELKQLRLLSNSLSGLVPSEIGLLSHLQRLELHNNSLTGMPSEMGLLSSNLTMLTMQGNRLDGSIATEVGLMQGLTMLSLSDNLLMGMLPSELGMLTNLMELYVANNPQLTGSIPWEVSNLVSNYGLGMFDVGGNENMEGLIQEELCYLQSPNCSVLLYPWRPPFPCTFNFDCGALCGCDCNCTSTQ